MTYNLELTKNQISILIKKYKEYELPSTNNYTLFRGKIKSSTLTIYKTNKVLLQGKDCLELLNDINETLGINNQIIQSNKKEQIDLNLGSSVIGSDEVGTGDYFGGITVCCCLVNKDKILYLKQLGIKDSKKLSDKKINELANILIKEFPHSVILLNNEKYNRISKIKDMNMNKIKAIMHNKAINNFLNKYSGIDYEQIIVDGFTTTKQFYDYLNDTGSVVPNIQLITEGEEKYISIAAASIIARYYFLKHFETLKKQSGYDLPRGASDNVDKMANKIIIEKGLGFLDNIAKVQFKNTIKAQNYKERKNE